MDPYAHRGTQTNLCQILDSGNGILDRMRALCGADGRELLQGIALLRGRRSCLYLSEGAVEVDVSAIDDEVLAGGVGGLRG